MDFKALENIIKECDSFSVFGHQNPDGDSVGAVLAMGRLLENHFGKKDIGLFSQGGVPDFFRSLPGVEAVTGNKEAACREVDLVLLLDCGSARRVGDDLSSCVENAKRVAVVDHHATNSGFGELNLTDPDASSTCELLYRFATAIDAEIDGKLATYLYTGIMYDTGRFIHSNTTPEVFEICSRLVAAGADPSAIATGVFNNRSESHLRLLGYVLSNFKTIENNTVAYCAIPRSTFDALGARDEDNEGVVEKMGGYLGCEVHTTIMELADGKIRVSMRSSGRVNVGNICKKLGGGGHDLAAGIRMSKTLDEVVEAVLSETSQALKNLEGGDA